MPGLQTEVPAQKGWGSLPNAEDQKFNTFRGGSSSAEGQGRRRWIPIVLAILVIALIAVVAAGVVSVRNGSSEPPLSDTSISAVGAGDDTAGDQEPPGDNSGTANDPLSDTSIPAVDAGDDTADDQEPPGDNSGTANDVAVPGVDFGSTDPDGGTSMEDYSLSTDQSMKFSTSMSLPPLSAGSVDFSVSFSLRRKERMLRKEIAKKARRTKRMTKRTAHD